ncbi:MAG: D-alanine--D-alanine ligase [Gemmatimonadetes bacterium]|nr:D-alanine--D-alanine ligase [Gemmatimonadota bacterium]
MTRVTVLTGGSTAERDVAFAGAAQVVEALRGRGYQVAVVDTATGFLSAKDEARYLVPSVGRAPPSAAELAAVRAAERGPSLVEIPKVRDADLVFLVLHGRQGEGGEIQALLDLAGIPYTGSDLLGSALAMDKDVAKRLFLSAGVPTPEWTLWPAERDTIARLGLPLIVKPSREGSTIGLSVVKGTADLEAAVGLAQRYDDEVILERYLPGGEFTVGVLGDRALAVGEIVPNHEIFDYECKYTPGMSREIFPASIDPPLTARIQALALAAHRALKLRDFSRVDFRLGADGSPYCLEANTLPGVTRTSLLPQSAAAAGMDFGTLCATICDLALRRTRFRNKVGA